MTETSSAERGILQRRESLPLSRFGALERHLNNIFSRRDEVYLSGRRVRIELFHRGVADLSDMIRKGADEAVLGEMLARVISRILCIARGINHVSVEKGLQMKFPLEGCGYCGLRPCQCTERRTELHLAAPDRTQTRWGLREWQQHLFNVYGEKNTEKGIDYILNRLLSEIGELISLEHNVPRLSMDEAEREYQLELADTLAWTIAVANVLEIDVEHAVTARYGKGCKVCGQLPCVCGDHSFDQVRF